MDPWAHGPTMPERQRERARRPLPLPPSSKSGSSFWKRSRAQGDGAPPSCGAVETIRCAARRAGTPSSGPSVRCADRRCRTDNKAFRRTRPGSPSARMKALSFPSYRGEGDASTLAASAFQLDFHSERSLATPERRPKTGSRGLSSCSTNAFRRSRRPAPNIQKSTSPTLRFQLTERGSVERPRNAGSASRKGPSECQEGGSRAMTGG